MLKNVSKFPVNSKRKTSICNNGVNFRVSDTFSIREEVVSLSPWGVEVKRDLICLYSLSQGTTCNESNYIDNQRHQNANDKLSLRQVWHINNLIGWEMFVLHVRHARCSDVWSVPVSAKKKHLDNYHIFVSTTTWEFLYLLWWCSFQFRVVICFANFVKCKQGAYSQNGYNGLFSSDVYLGAAVVVWWISAFDATYSVIYQSKLLLQFFPVLFKVNCNSHFRNIWNDEFSVVSTELLSYCHVGRKPEKYERK